MPTLAIPLRPSMILQRLRSKFCAATVHALCFAILVALGGCCLVGSVVFATARVFVAQGEPRTSFPGPPGRVQPAAWRGRRAAALSDGETEA